MAVRPRPPVKAIAEMRGVQTPVPVSEAPPPPVKIPETVVRFPAVVAVDFLFLVLVLGRLALPVVGCAVVTVVGWAVVVVVGCTVVVVVG
jgi:hypothetical protein